MDVIDAYKELWHSLWERPANKWMLLGFMGFQYSVITLFHGFGFDVGFAEAFWSGFKASCMIWCIFALISAAARIGGLHE